MPWYNGEIEAILKLFVLLKNKNFARLRTGVGRPPRGKEAAEYVLRPFNRQEKIQLGRILESATACLDFWVAQGIDKTMNIFNKRSKDE